MPISTVSPARTIPSMWVGCVLGALLVAVSVRLSILVLPATMGSFSITVFARPVLQVVRHVPELPSTHVLLVFQDTIYQTAAVRLVWLLAWHVHPKPPVFLANQLTTIQDQTVYPAYLTVKPVLILQLVSLVPQDLPWKMVSVTLALRIAPFVRVLSFALLATLITQ